MASNRPRQELIAELVELGRTAAMVETTLPNDKVDETLRAVRLRLALCGPNPSEELITQVLNAVEAEARNTNYG
ncbi:Hypothetical predicted protein [Pelobates cultripes]|uniref:Uncharacterized protein n=1 Tax=Pelobates cultripes TaxID=61616 RepID=A0AAD1W578_PELCU|nr:Hypothetical predicted protein [Pelobates cultripes]